MPATLRVSIGQASDKGRKETNQDFHGALIPEEPLLGLKGIVVALADGIGSSQVSHVASESAVKAMMTDYYCTSEAWTVKTSASRVMAATNSWLHAQTRASQFRYDIDKGYVTTLSLLVVKGATVHLFHVGDARIYRLAGTSLEQLSSDHRVVVSPGQHYLARALGADREIEIDYQALPAQAGDVFVLATDGVHEHLSNRAIARVVGEGAGDLDGAAWRIVGMALENGSDDNLTVQIVRIDAVADFGADEMGELAIGLPPAPPLQPRMQLDGYTIIRQVHGSHRSQVHLAVDGDGGARVAIKIPATECREDGEYLRRFLLEEWAARRIDSPHVLAAHPSRRSRSSLYVVTEYVEGPTLRQWMIDHPRPDIESVRGLVEQIAKGLRAFHRREMLHQDLRPENIILDATGTAKIIDFGSVRVEGVAEAGPMSGGEAILGTAQYTAPEYFLGEGGTSRSDIFSLGVIAYEMLTGRLPYGAEVAKTKSRSQQRKLHYQSASDGGEDIPAWIDGALRKAVHIDPTRRYGALSHFVHDLRHPNLDLVQRKALLERNPLLFWKSLSALLAVVVIVLAYRLAKGAG